jgi:hypothetical protein
MEAKQNVKSPYISLSAGQTSTPPTWNLHSHAVKHRRIDTAKTRLKLQHTIYWDTTKWQDDIQ